MWRKKQGKSRFSSPRREDFGEEIRHLGHFLRRIWALKLTTVYITQQKSPKMRISGEENRDSFKNLRQTQRKTE